MMLEMRVAAARDNRRLLGAGLAKLSLYENCHTTICIYDYSTWVQKGGAMVKPREARHSVLIRGRMRAGGTPEDVCVRDISNNGMMLQAHVAPEAGTYVEVQLPDEVVVGRVMWARDRRFGIRTRDRLPLWRLLGRKKPEPGPDAPAQRAAAGTAVARGRSDARAWGRSFEFLCLAGVAVGAATAMAYAGYAILAAVAEKVTGRL